jgi:hypothetical protein
MDHGSYKNKALGALLCVLVGFLTWWWWPRSAAVQTAAPRPLPKGIAERPPLGAHPEPAGFDEVKLPGGEVGFTPRLTGGQLDQLKKSGSVVVRGPGGGVITISQPDKDKKSPDAK